MTDFVAPGDFSDLGIKLEDDEPDVSIDLISGESLVFKASGMSYTRDQFPNDSYVVAAKKIAKQFFVWRTTLGMTTNKDISLFVSSYKDHPSKTITFGATGVRHNYENLDTWHHWFMEHLNEEVKRLWK